MQPNNGSFFGLRLSQPGIPLNLASPSQLLYQNDLQTETWRDNQGNKTLQIGILNDGTYGLEAYTSSGTSTLELNGNGLSINPGSSNSYINMTSDKISVYQNGVEQIRIGLLPDSTYGMVITKPGISVDSAYS